MGIYIDPVVAAGLDLAAHTPGLLCHDAYYLTTDDDATLASLVGDATATELRPAAEANAARLAACWNACDGLTLAQLDGLGPGGVVRLAAALGALGWHLRSWSRPSGEWDVRNAAAVVRDMLPGLLNQAQTALAGSGWEVPDA